MQDGCSVACAKWADDCDLIYSGQETELPGILIVPFFGRSWIEMKSNVP